MSPTPTTAAEPVRVGVARATGAALAAVGCLLPWEQLAVSPPGGATGTPLDGLHGLGLLSCMGAVVALLLVALRLRSPGADTIRVDVATAVCGAAVIGGAALFPWVNGGYPPGSSVGDQSSVGIGPGLPLTAVAGMVLLAVGLRRLSSRRGLSPRPGSAAAPRPR